MNPTLDPHDPAAEDPRLIRAAQEYLAELEAGRQPERGVFVARYPSELAEHLLPYLDALDMVQTAMPSRPLSGRTPTADPPPVEPIGDFRIVHEIGRGGMGVVYEAVQLSLGRRVALKVLPFAAALDAKQLQRFQNEAQAAAQLHHTNIVPVYAVGCERGVHYYAMQLIEGQNLAEMIGQMRPQEATADRERVLGNRPPAASSAPDVPQTGPEITEPVAAPASATINAAGAALSTQRATRSSSFYRAVARLAAQAAEALEHAHQLGVIHRDVKPANLMVDMRGNLWVTDFGLAQFQNRAGLTRTGDLLGTLRYMSPEQAAGEGQPLGPRTDVYSLGATLYELLTLEPLFGGGDHARLLRQIIYDEPRPLRALDRQVPAELETIVLKAVSKSPSDRYATAQELADDLHRFLGNQPIRARRPTLAQHARKWAQRHPAVVGAGILLCVLTAAGSLTSAVLLRAEESKTQAALNRESEAKKATEVALKSEQDRAEEAEAQFQLALRMIEDLVKLGETELVDKPGLEGLRKRLLESALVYYQQSIDLRHGDRKAEADLRETRTKVGEIIADLTSLQGAWQLRHLGNPDVLDDLKMTEDQRQKMPELLNRLGVSQRDSFRDFHRISSEERDKRFRLAARANDEAARQILTVKQLARLRQIDLQLQGAHAFSDSEIATALALTDKQREQLRVIEAEALFTGPGGGFGGFGGRPGGGPGGPGGGPGGMKPGNSRKESAEKIQKVLSAEQLARWKEMTGEPFEVRRRDHGPIP
jgi:serine/threonine protein kinase